MELSDLKFDSQGLIPAVVVDYQTNEVLMVGYMNAESFQATVETGHATFWSRSRQKFWIKGETSGHFQNVKWLRLDCDGDCLLVGAEQVGAACHAGYRSCFYRELREGQWELCSEQVFDPNEKYGK
ncbi:MAG TPA: phosphoribosyl-AMP cyclohydrolase [Armatimonadota bacterium]